jgi:hypothetical protein
MTRWGTCTSATPPKAIVILNALLGHRNPALPGYAPDEWGADVDPELLAGSHSPHRPWLLGHRSPRWRLTSRACPEVRAATQALVGSERDDG